MVFTRSFQAVILVRLSGPDRAATDVRQERSDAREAEGAPLLREYRVKSSIEGSNPSHSAIESTRFELDEQTGVAT